MKECPKCGTTYTDDSLRFCLADGSPLNMDEQPTIVRTSLIPAAEKTIALPAKPNAHAASPNAGASGSSVMKIVLGVIALSILLLVGVGLAGVFYYYYSAPTPVSTTPTTQPTTEPSGRKDPDDELQKRIADLVKQLNDQRRQAQNSNASVKPPERTTGSTIAIVNSPGDGFLALRSLPNSQSGERITKIPHGARVAIGACGPVVTPVKRSGRWCQASYGGYDGWVFDAYLNYE